MSVAAAGSTPSGSTTSPQILGRYALYDELASGGMATVHFGRLLGPVGFSRTVAIKRLHPQFAKDPEFVSMFLDEARVAARVQHPNVVSTLDVVATEGELFLVMEYVEGESLARILRQIRASGARIPPKIVGSIITGLLHGLHAAHEARSERGDPLHIIHRDVSPQNVIVGSDGVARVLDFGVAKAAGRMQHTREGQLKGKLAYMAPEQIAGEELDRRADIYAAGVVLWEAIACRRLFDGENEGAIISKIASGNTVPPSRWVPDLPRAVDDICLRALSLHRRDRFKTALEMAVLLEQSLGTEPNWRVGNFVKACAHEAISLRTARVKQMENMSTEVEGMAMPFTGGTPLIESRSTEARSRRRTMLIVGLLVLLFLSVGTSLVVVFTEATKEEAAREGTATPTPAPTALPPTPNPTATTTPPIAADPSSDARGSAQASSEPAQSATAKPTVRVPFTAKTVVAPPTAVSPADCYYLENGIKKIRPSCIK